MACTEYIRLEVGGRPPQVLNRIEWIGAEPTQATFLKYAKSALEGCYEPESFEPKPGFGAMRGGLPVPEGVRFLADDGSERWRYTLFDLHFDRESMATYAEENPSPETPPLT